MTRYLPAIACLPLLAASLPAMSPLGVPLDHLQSRRPHAPTNSHARGSIIEQTNGPALREHDAARSLNATQIYPFFEGSLFRLYAAPGMISDIALQPGESLVSVAAGDTVRWVIGDTTSGTATAKRTHILVKPTSSGLRTNLVISTDRRIYLVLLESRSLPAMTGIAWSYPADDLIALRASQEAREAAAPVAEGIGVDSLNFDYSIEGDRPSWRPIRAFDDGHQTFVEFPPTLGSGEAPPLFVVGSSGKAELVNFRVRGRYYVVDRLFSIAELRLGEKHQQIVRIIRNDTRRPRRPA